MTEILEYCLTLAVGSLFAVGSVAVYGNYTSFESSLQLHALLGDLTSLASQAFVNGSVAATLSFPDSTLACQGSTLTLSSGSFSAEGTVQGSCSFATKIAAGVHRVSFSASSSLLQLKVA